MENQLAESLKRHGKILTLEESTWKSANFFKGMFYCTQKIRTSWCRNN